MDTLGLGRPLEIGSPAPDFTLMLVDKDQPISLADYRQNNPLLLGLFRGTYCAFCRRAVVRLGMIGEKLRPLGIETLGVIGTTLNNARLYFRYHPTRMALAVDADLAAHRAYGLQKIAESWEAVSSMRVNPSGELPEALPVWEAAKALGRLDGFRPTDTDRDEMKRTWNQSVGEFLIDRDGIIRWVYVEGPADYVAKFPSEEALLSVAHTLTRTQSQRE